jgi:hypothetical protein
MLFAPTFHDVRKRKNFALYQAISEEVAELRESGRTNSIPELTAFAPHCEKLWEEKLIGTIKSSARDCGISFETALDEYENNPQMRNFLSWQEEAFFDEYYFALNCQLFGNKTFFLQDGLVQQLACTEMNVIAPLLQLPFPSCIFVLTSKDAIDALYRFNLAQHPDAMPIQINYSAPLTVFLVQCDPYEGMPERSLNIRVCHANELETFLSVKWHLCLADTWSLSEVLNTDWSRIIDNPVPARTFVSEDVGWGEVNDDLFYGDRLLFLRIIVNAVLYISSADAEKDQKRSPQEELKKQIRDMNSREKSRDLKQQARHVSELPYVLVGGSIPLISEDSLSEASRDRRKLSIRFTVRGHWRNQACGTGMKNHVLRFIKPYNKGPEMAEIINKPYLVRLPSASTLQH